MQYRSSNPNTRVGFTLVVIASLAMGPFSNDVEACEWVPAGSYPAVQGEVQQGRAGRQLGQGHRSRETQSRWE